MESTPQVLIAGPEGSGKTALLYNQITTGSLGHNAKIDTTIGFQYEETDYIGQ